jgi:hypothetical protein
VTNLIHRLGLPEDGDTGDADRTQAGQLTVANVTIVNRLIWSATPVVKGRPDATPNWMSCVRLANGPVPFGVRIWCCQAVRSVKARVTAAVRLETFSRR